jgi:hypothetical protein
MLDMHVKQVPASWQQGSEVCLTCTEAGEKPTVVELKDGRAGLWDCKCSSHMITWSAGCTWATYREPGLH